MKYLIFYQVGNGYHCGCCSQWDDKTKEIDNYLAAVGFVAELFIDRDFRYDSIEAIPESFNDFIRINENEKINFDVQEFDLAVSQMIPILVKKKQDQQKLIEEKEQEDRKKALDEQERAEYLRLKAKFES